MNNQRTAGMVLLLLMFALTACGAGGMARDNREPATGPDIQELDVTSRSREILEGGGAAMAEELPGDVEADSAAEETLEEPVEEEPVEEELTEEAPAEEMASGDPATGEALFKASVIGDSSAPGCAGCHSLEPGQRLVGPTMAGIASIAADRVDGQSADEYLRMSIVNSNAYVVESYAPNIMPQLYGEALTEAEVDHLVAYLLTLE